MTDLTIRDLYKDPNALEDTPSASSDAVWIQYLDPRPFFIPRSRIYFSDFADRRMNIYVGWHAIPRYDDDGNRVSKRRLRRLVGKLRGRYRKLTYPF